MHISIPYRLYRTILFGFLLCLGMSLVGQAYAQNKSSLKTQFKSVRTQFIAALGEPNASSGNNAQHWGIWREDPGPRGVRLNRYAQLEKADGIAPAGWQLDSNSWWLEEHGLIMEQPDFPLPVGQYLVTGDQKLTTVLTIFEKDADGNQHWQLAEGSLYDVTHLACRSALYTPITEHSCTPTKVNKNEFPVSPGAVMPEVEGCNKQDYAVLFIVGVAK